jgi:hypothetical protein
MKHKINSYVTDRGGVVVLDGPFPLADAHKSQGSVMQRPRCTRLVRPLSSASRTYSMSTPTDAPCSYWTKRQEPT